jgi:hypothetical protein
MWEDQKLQTFYKGTCAKYFRVKGNERPLTREGINKAKSEEEAARRMGDVVEKNEGRGENSPWLERTGWKRTFAGVVFATRSQAIWNGTRRGFAASNSVRR